MNPLSRENDPQRGGMCFATFLFVYTNHLEVRYPKSDHAAQVRRILERFQRYQSLISRPIAAITQRDIAEYISRRRSDLWRGQPLANRTLNNEINAINAAFAWAGPKLPYKHGRANQEFISDPPYYQPLPEDDPLPVCLEESQLTAFLDATRFATSPRPEVCDPRMFWTAALFLVGITSLRREALLNVPRPDDYLLLERREIRLPAAMSKTRREELIPLGTDERIVRVFASLPTKPGEPILPWRDRLGRRMSLSHFNHAMAKFQRRAGIAEDQRVTPQAVRSTVATKVVDEFNEAVAKKRLGHSPKTTTINTNYLNRRPRDTDRAASDYLADWLFGAAATALGPAPEPEPTLRIVG